MSSIRNVSSNLYIYLSPCVFHSPQFPIHFHVNELNWWVGGGGGHMHSTKVVILRDLHANCVKSTDTCTVNLLLRKGGQCRAHFDYAPHVMRGRQRNGLVMRGKNKCCHNSGTKVKLGPNLWFLSILHVHLKVITRDAFTGSEHFCSA